MRTEKNEGEVDVLTSIENAEKTLHEGISQGHPEWIDKNGECNACVSLEHEMAAMPDSLPKEFE